MAIEEGLKKLGSNLSGLLSADISVSFLTLDGVRAYSFGNPDAQLSKDVLACAVLDELKKSAGHKNKQRLRYLFAWASSCHGVLHLFDPKMVSELVLDTEDNWSSDAFSLSSEKNQNISEHWVEFFDSFGRKSIRLTNSPIIHPQRQVNWMLERYKSNPNLVGLLKLVGLSSLHLMPSASSCSIVDICLDNIINNHISSDVQTKVATIALAICTPSEQISISKILNLVDTLAIESLDEQLLHFLINTIERYGVINHQLLAVLDVVLDRISAGMWRLKGDAENIRSTVVQAKPAEFTKEKLVELHLPAIS